MANYGASSVNRTDPSPQFGVPAAAARHRAPAEDTFLISLHNPRPVLERARNVYIDTPLRPQPPEDREAADSNSRWEKKKKGQRPLPLPSALSRPAAAKTLPVIKSVPPVTAQPKPLPLSSGVADGRLHGGSILCPACGRCRCEACCKTRPLPSRWICNDKCRCSAEEVVDCCSCVCCVKALLYHCGPEAEDEPTCSEDPCSCAPGWRWFRWSLMGVLAVFLPCLCCYWPMRGCLRVCELCYQRCTRRGCRCPVPRKGVLV